MTGRSGSIRAHLHPDERTGKEPDYRFTLANERRFLVYVRTALGLDAAGLGVDGAPLRGRYPSGRYAMTGSRADNVAAQLERTMLA